jgi:hypothetical protein
MVFATASGFATDNSLNAKSGRWGADFTPYSRSTRVSTRKLAVGPAWMGAFECVGYVKMDTDTLKRICQNGSVADFTARKAVMYAEIGSAANLAYHFGLCQALMKEALVT